MVRIIRASPRKAQKALGYGSNRIEKKQVKTIRQQPHVGQVSISKGLGWSKHGKRWEDTKSIHGKEIP